MNIYHLLRLASGKMPPRLKLLGLWAMLVSGRRMTGIFVDPVMACNLRCRMCYFSDPQKRAALKGMMTQEQIDSMGKALFHRAAKLQIGCGAEPTLFPGLKALVEQGAKAGIPYISLTTNGKAIAQGKVNLADLVEAGLSELTLSLHGTCREVYENLMEGASFDDLMTLTDIIADVKSRYPQFTVRVNFTVNSLNVDDLRNDRFWTIWKEGGAPDIVQLRPVQNMGDTSWNDFDLQPLKDKYDDTIGAVVEECKRRNIICLAPSLKQLDMVDDVQDGVSSIINDITYCYVDSSSCYHADFTSDDSFESYHRRCRTATRLFAKLFLPLKNTKRHASKKLNYQVTK